MANSPAAQADDGVTFPCTGGTRATTQAGRGILADAARAADPELARRVEATRDWRGGYVGAFHELTAACAASPKASLAIAEAGLAALHARMVLSRDAGDRPLGEGLPSGRATFATRTVQGTADPVAELRLPYHGRELSGELLTRQLERWHEAKVMEASVVDAIRAVAEHPEWLALPGRRIALVGAAAEMGPLEPLCAWGATVIAIDLRNGDIQARLGRTAQAGAGAVSVPVAADGASGADLIRDLPEVAQWLEQAAGEAKLVLGNYAYADGGLHVRVTAAFDALVAHVQARRQGTAIAGLATPTDAFVVPAEVVSDARAAWRARGARRYLQLPLQIGSGRRVFAPAYDADDGVANVLIPQQGPNYALAKRIQRWRALAADQRGQPVSFNVAPPSWTQSVMKNRLLAAAYAGARHFGVEIFPPETSRVLMAAALVHDLHRASSPPEHPEALFSDGAVHGGLWRTAYDPRSVLPLAALAGALRLRRG